MKKTTPPALLRKKPVRGSGAFQRALGALSHKMRDHVYFLKQGYIYTTPHIVCRMNMKFYAAILMTADRRPFSVKIDGREIKATAFMMRPGTKFVFAAHGIEHVCVFVEPTHALFGRFQTIGPMGLTIERNLFAKLDAFIDEAFQGRLTRARAIQFFEEAVTIANNFLPFNAPLDKRISKIVKTLATGSPRSLSDLARSAGVSYFRLSHIFKENLGITLRKFLQWKKVSATASSMATRSITDVAHEVGFVDSAHLTRTFQDLFGVPPSYLTNAKFVRRFFYQ